MRQEKAVLVFGTKTAGTIHPSHYVDEIFILKTVVDPAHVGIQALFAAAATHRAVERQLQCFVLGGVVGETGSADGVAVGQVGLSGKNAGELQRLIFTQSLGISQNTFV